MALAQALLTIATAFALHDVPAGKAEAPRPAAPRSGIITNDDYPASALREGAEGMTVVRYLVGEDGRVVQCVIDRSSGHSALDSTSCSLVQRRYRFRPAVGAAGHPSAEWRTETIRWSLPDQASPSPVRLTPEGSRPAE